MAKTSRLTNQAIESTSVQVGERWLSDDDGGRGGGRLAVRLRPDGRRLFYFRYSIGGQRKAVPLGPFSRTPTPGYLTLEEAREVVRGYSALHRDPTTRDVQGALAKAKEVAVPPTPPATGDLPDRTKEGASQPTLLDLCNHYVDGLRRLGKQSANTVASYVRCHVAPTQWANIPANEFTSEQTTELLRAIIEAGHGPTAKHVRSSLHAAYESAKAAPTDPRKPRSIAAMGIKVNPIHDTNSLVDLVVARERAPLTHMELGHLWIALSEADELDQSARFTRVSFLLGGQRCLQLLRAMLTSIDTDNSTITLSDPKGRRPKPRVHILPLNPMALAEVIRLRQNSKDLANPYLFAGRKKGRPLNPSVISRAMQALSARLVAEGKLSQKFEYANIRSTIETRLAELGVPPDVRAQIQSHGISGVQVKHYDRWNYMPEKRAALLKWEAFLTECARQARLATSS